jgi:hypothetical protein
MDMGDSRASLCRGNGRVSNFLRSYRDMWVLVAGIAGTGDGACYNNIIIHCCFTSSIDTLSSDHLTKFCKKFINIRQKNHFFDGSCRLKNASCQMPDAR